MIKTNSKDFLNKIVTIEIDRPLNSKHPKYSFVYGLNYGYIPNTISGDGEELDAYILGISEPLQEFTGRCIAVIHRLNDDDDKLIVVPDGQNFSNEEIEKLVNFQEKWFEHVVIR